MKLFNIEEFRFYSRELIRELGFLENPYERWDLNFLQVHLLLECERHGSIDQQKLTKILRVDKSYVSRMVKVLIKKGLIALLDPPSDNRSKPVMLTAAGHLSVAEINDIANQQVRSAINYLSEEEQGKIAEGMRLYSQALKKARHLKGVIIRPVEKKDNAALSALIKTTLIEFGANRPGFAFTDEETNAIFESYQGCGRGYFVAEKSNSIIGGIGYGPLLGAESTDCELRKMYIIKEVRGIGLGDELLHFIQKEAKKFYQVMYLETLSSMTQAISLYRRHQFEFLKKPKGNTGHFSCDTWMEKIL